MEPGGRLRRGYPQGGVSALLILLVACFCSSLAFADSTQTLRFEIPAGDAQKTLLQFLTQSNIEMLYTSDDVRGVTTRAVAGQLTIPEALRRMLEGTGLEISFENNFTFASIQRPKKIDTGSETPLEIAAFANARTYAPNLPDATAAKFATEPKLAEIVVTGTLIHGVLDIMSPLTRMTRKDMKQSSYATVQDALQMLPMNSGGGPSEDVNSTGNFNRGTAANLRGLGSGATLVLVNGHRRPYSGTEGDFADVSNIPWGAVERIDVLPDGASALYGSDAIAGVVNIIMRKDFDGGETQGRLGSSLGGADERVFGQLFGNSWERGNFLLSYQYSERTALAAADRTYAANTDKTSLGGTDHRSFRSSPGNILDPRTLLPAFGIPSGQDGKSLTAADLMAGNINLQNAYGPYEMLPEKRMHSLFLSGSQKVGERYEIFGEGLFSKRDLTQRLFGAEQPLFVPNTNPFFVSPFSGLPFVVVGYSFLNDLGPLVLHSEADSYSGTLGVNVKLGDRWHLVLSESYARERTEFRVENQPDAVALGAALADSDPATAFNPFGDGFHNNPATLEKVRTAQRGSATSDVNTSQIIADGPIKNLSSGQIKLALGAERREETLDRRVFVNGLFGRSINSAFAELSIPIEGDGGDPRAVPRLELSLAGRVESYSDFGTTTNPKIGLRWAPSNSLKLRTSWGTSFRAPKLVDLYNTSQNLATLLSLTDPRSETGTSVVLARFGNNPELKEETASTWTAGIDFAPEMIPGLSVSLTYYAIDYEDQIAQPSAASSVDILVHESQWSSSIERNPSLTEVSAICNSSVFRGAPQQCAATSVAAIVDFSPRNFATTRVRGIDLKLDHSVETRFGKFSAGLNGGYVFSFEQAASTTSPTFDIVNTVGNPLAFRVRGTTEWYQRDWDRPGFGISVAVDHSAAYADTISATTRGIGAMTTADMRLSYRTARDHTSLDDIEFGLNVSNLFNSSPPFVDREVGYDASNAQPYGRVVSFSLQKSW